MSPAYLPKEETIEIYWSWEPTCPVSFSSESAPWHCQIIVALVEPTWVSVVGSR